MKGHIRTAIAILCGLTAPIFMASDDIPTAVFGVCLLMVTAICLESIRRQQINEGF